MWTILLAVDVPLVTKNVRWAPKQRAASSCASLIVPVGSSSESSPPAVELDSAMKRLSP